MSSDVSRYVDFKSACPRCQQIIQTIDLTFQQGIFIYDLTFIQQELESVLVGALQRHETLLNCDGESNLKLPLSSMIKTLNGKKTRDFKAERERRKNAFNGCVSKKRRKKIARKNSEKSFSSIRQNRSDCSIRKTIDEFWSKIVSEVQHEILSRDDFQSIENLIHLDRSILKHHNDVNQYKNLVKQKGSMLFAADHRHFELDESIVVKQNQIFREKVLQISRPNSEKKKNNKKSTNEFDPNVFQMFRREENQFESKIEQLEHFINESIILERFALQRAERQIQYDQIRLELKEINEKIFQITNAIRQRKRPNENLLSVNKNRGRISTNQVYDELERLIDEHLELEKQLELLADPNEIFL